LLSSSSWPSSSEPFWEKKKCKKHSACARLALPRSLSFSLFLLASLAKGKRREMSSSSSLLRVCGGASTSKPSSIIVVGTAAAIKRSSLRRRAGTVAPRRLRSVAVAASGNGDDRISSSSSSSSPLGGGLDPSLELAVPKDQRPSNELASLRTAPLYSWVS